MAGEVQTLVRLGLWGLGTIRAPRLLSGRHSGMGGILSFHRIYEPQAHEYGAHAASVSPHHFRHLLTTMLGQGYVFLSISQLVDVLTGAARNVQREKIACLTFDDGFVDTYTSAYAICRDLGVPLTVYLVSGMMRREFPMWSLALEEIIEANAELAFSLGRESIELQCSSPGEKRSAFFTAASRFAHASAVDVSQACRDLSARYGVDSLELTDRTALTMSMIAEMQQSGLVEFGAHSVHHLRLGDLDEATARWEIGQSKRDCEAMLGEKVHHFAYPYGDARAAGGREQAFCRELGFRSAVTTESNTIFPTDCERLMALPRLTYNGLFQSEYMLDLLLSGTLPLMRRTWKAAREARRA